MSGYDASVKFNSGDAERKVNSFSKSIGNLRTTLRNASEAGKSFGTGINNATSGASKASTRIRVLDRDLTKLGAAAKGARNDLIAFGKAVDSSTISRAAASLGKMASEFGKLADSTRRTDRALKGITASLTTFREKAGTAATAARSLATALGRVADAASRASRGISGASRAMGGLGGTSSTSSASVGSAAKATNAASNAAAGLSRSAQRAANGMGRLGSASREANESLLASAAIIIRFRNLAGFLATGFGIQALADAADTYKLVSARLNLVATSTANLDSLQQRLIASSNETRTGYRENAALFTKLAQAGAAYGISQEQSLTVTENVAKALKISGASASESAAATQQLSQAFASGRIQGDELRSVLENSPRLAQALATELADLGINLGNVRDKAAEGKIGITELVRAFGSASITKQLAAEFELIPTTIADSLQIAKNKFVEFIGELDKATGISNGVIATVKLLADNLGILATVIGFIAVTQIGKLIAGFLATRVAAIALAATLGGVTTQMGALGLTARVAGASIFAAFGNAAGLLTGGVAVAIGYVINKNYELSESIKDADTKLADANARFDTYSQAAQAAGISTAFSGDAANVAGGKFSLLGNLIGGTISKYEQLAASARFAAIAVAQANIAEARSSINKSLRRTAIAGAIPGGREIGNIIGIGGDDEEINIRKNEALILREQSNIDIINRLPENSSVFRRPTVTAPSGSNSAGNKRNKGGGGADKIDQTRTAFLALQSQLDSVEAAREKFKNGMDTLDAALAKNIITADRYKELMGSLAKDTFKGLADEIKDLSKENEALQNELNGGSAATIKFKEGVALIKEQVKQIDYTIKQEGDKSGVLTAQRNILLGQVDTYAEMINQNEQLKTQNEARKKQEADIAKLIDESSDRIFEMLTGRIRDALSFSKGSFKSFFKDILGMAKDIFSEILGAYIFEPLRASFRKALGGAFGSQAEKDKADAPAIGQGVVSQVKLELGTVISQAVNDNTPTGTSATASQPSSAASSTEPEPIVVDAPKGFIPNLVASYRGFGRDLVRDLGTVFKPVGKALKPVIEKLGINASKLGETAGKALAGAQIGGTIASIGKALGVKTSKLGGQIGGAIGGAVGGPIGSLIGGTIGSLVGGLFKKTKFATAVVSGVRSENISTSGNSASREKAATGSGGAIGKTIQSIADQLGGSVGAFRVSIGTYKDEFRVSNTGRTGKLKNKYSDVKNFGKDGEAEAIAYAIQEAIKQGAIKGIRAATQRLLTSSDDLESALKDAVDFENVFKTVEQRANPTKYAMTQLGKEFERLTELFKRAGASSEEFATLGEYFRQETKAVLESVTEGLRKFRDDLIGGEASYKSPTARLAIANTRFSELEAQIASGKFVDQNTFTEAGQALQALARQVYGSTPEFQAYQARLLEATEKLIANAETEANTLQPVIDALNTQTNAATTIGNQTNALLEAIVNGAALGSAPSGGTAGAQAYSNSLIYRYANGNTF